MSYVENAQHPKLRKAQIMRCFAQSLALRTSDHVPSRSSNPHGRNENDPSSYMPSNPPPPTSYRPPATMSYDPQPTMSPAQLTIPAEHHAMHQAMAGVPHISHHPDPYAAFAQPIPPPISPTNSRKRRLSEISSAAGMTLPSSASSSGYVERESYIGGSGDINAGLSSSVAKKSRTNTPWTPAEEQRLKTMRDAGSSWSEIAKVRMDDIGLVALVHEFN